MEASVQKQAMPSRKRKKGLKKSGGKAGKRMKTFPVKGKKIDKKMQKLFRKRAREYNSDDDEESNPEAAKDDKMKSTKIKDKFQRKSQQNAEKDQDMLEQYQDTDEDKEEEMQPGIMRFTEGCRAFRMAFANIIKRRHIDDDDLGPILSANKKLVVAKLAEEEEERKVKKETKKEKHLAGEKGQVKPANYLDSHEKFLISVATKGVVKLFNAVNKAQNAQRGLNPSRSKDAKVLRQRRKQVFFSELSKGSGQSADGSSKVNSDQPAWAPLRDSFMLTNPKLKDWDKMAEDTTGADDIGSMSDVSSDDE